MEYILLVHWLQNTTTIEAANKEEVNRLCDKILTDDPLAIIIVTKYLRTVSSHSSILEKEG